MGPTSEHDNTNVVTLIKYLRKRWDYNMEKVWEARCQAIEQGQEQEKYLDWLHDKTEGNLYVRETLAENGYLLKELAKDNTAYIRTTIMTRYPESIKYVLAYQKYKRGLTYDEWALIYETLRASTTIDADAITDFLIYELPEGLVYYQGRLDETIPAFKAQLEAYRHPLEPFHKTMTSKQLYEAKSPHWVRGLSAQAIVRVQYAENELHHDRNKVARIFDTLITDGTGCDVEMMLDTVDREKRRPD